MSKRPDFASMMQNATEFTSADSQELPDPTLPTRIRLNLTQVIAFKNNPRKTRNPKYDEIKESIRTSGLDTPPDVTRENPSDPYMIRNGGNTRLEILNELWNETGDRKFFEFDCIFHPWTDEFDLFIRHVKENEMRGQMSFIERALAAKKAKEEIEKLDGKSISTNQLSKRLTDKGWPIDQSNLNNLLYAENKLLPLIPNAFWELNIGIDSVKKIRKLIDHCESYWKQVATVDDGAFTELLSRVCTRLDTEAFTIDRLEYELCGEIARAMGGAVSSVQSQIQALAEKIIEPAALTRPSSLKEIEQLSPQNFKSTITKSKNKAAKESATKTNSQPSASTELATTEKPLAADELSMDAPYLFPIPCDYDFLNALSLSELQELAYEKVVNVFRCSSTALYNEILVDDLVHQLIEPASSTIFGFRISLSPDLVNYLAKDDNILGQALWILSLMSDTRNRVQTTQFLLHASGHLSAEETVGYLLNFLQYRTQCYSVLSLNIPEIYPWINAITEFEYVMAAIISNFGYMQPEADLTQGQQG